MVKNNLSQNKYSNAVLKRALQQQLLEFEIKQNAASLQIEELLYKIQELQAWKQSAKDFVDKAADDRRSFNRKIAMRETNVVARERRLEQELKQLKNLKILTKNNEILVAENERLKKRFIEMKAMKEELLIQQKQRGQEIELATADLRVVERLFVQHLEEMMLVDVTMHKQIGNLGEDPMKKGRNLKIISRERLREELKAACSECPPGTAGSGIDRVANNLLEKLSTTYKEASKTSEDLSRRCDKLEADLKATTEQLMNTIKEKSSMQKKLKAEELNLRAMKKRVDRLSHGEVGELRAMLTHSHKHYSELNGMLREFLKFSQEEMRKSLGFVPRTVIQVSEICKTVPENPLEDFEGYTPPGAKSPKKNIKYEPPKLNAIKKRNNAKIIAMSSKRGNKNSKANNNTRLRKKKSK
eukprot:g7974.t1